ncbi:family 14 glycosylhydrolase [Paenibacillus sp. YPG26]|uniref:family 14 glycosylhydrolase n=1 Tax=Paenibacillus sp. YPG26 TaxID=2878915 RepID=UPI0020422207|nr:family 14 glycosylhydrolase [Paenibacillus sp. YPG26]USB32576.1 family 14 glycosylhydrolase [Paenibacillus sp. YPG26]
MHVTKALMKRGYLFTLIFTLIFSSFLTPFTNTARAEVANDFQAYVMAPLTKINDWNAFKNQLKTLKDSGVYALTTDVWWGDVEAAGDNQFDWSYYKKYADAVSASGLKWVPILSTHTCGGNPGDDCNIPIPSWLWGKGSADEMKYKSETGYVNNEALSPFWSGINKQYNELYASFASNFSSYKGLIAKIYLSGGASGELRYPSYYQAAGWSYPSRGKFQVYTETAKNAFRTAMVSKYGSLSGVNQAWGLQLTSESQINPPSDGDAFYSTGGYNTTYGKDFLGWYQGVLENHLGVIAQAAHSNFDSVFGVRIGAKISGIHWQMTNPSAPHSAEHAAGYYDYSRIIQKFKDNDLDLTFTALEMHDDGRAPAYSTPSTLVDTISSIANAKGVRLNGENALPTSDFQKIEQQITRWNYNGFTLLRFANLVNPDGSPTGNLEGYKKYVISHAKPIVNPDGNKVTIYYKKGFNTPYLHYRPAGGAWTTAPGKAITDAAAPYTGYGKITVDIGSATQLEAAFNNGSGTWDSNNSKNYIFNTGTFTFTPGADGAPGTIAAGEPVVKPDDTESNVTIYYKKGFTNPYIHYRQEGGTWTTAPGTAMANAEAAYPGYAKITLPLGSASRIEAAFNNGSGTWDSNNMKNYFFSKGTFTFTPGADGAPGTIAAGEPVVKPDDTESNVTIYYKKGFTNPYIHYRQEGGTWTTAPGTAMGNAEAAYPGYAKITLPLGSASRIEAAFNNGSGTWDSNNMKNYFFSKGTFTYTPGANGATGTIAAGAPEIVGDDGSTATIYYKKGFNTPYIHYRAEGGTWTTSPGSAMADAEATYPGYAKITIPLGTASRVEAAFNNGSGTWDSNNMKNYFFSKGTSTYTPGANGAAGTITSGVPSKDPGNTGATDWSKQSIYFIMTDRFSNGDTSNDNAYGIASNKSDPKKWHGGDFQGIINQLDYIKNMGFTAIWITPVTAQKSEYAYHGYHTYDFYSVDGHLGTMEKLKELVDTAHSKQISVMLDVVPNHTGDFQPYNGTAKAPFNNPDWYHHNGEITKSDYEKNDQWKIENGDVAGLDDLNHENPAVVNELKNWVKWILAETKIDGLRVDTAKHMPKWFLKEFDAAANTFTMGEIFEGSSSKVGDYSNYLDAVIDFPMYYTIRDVFGQDQSTTKIKDRYTEDGNYRDAKLNGIFLDNHDVKRFLNEASGNPSNRSDKWPQLKAALGFVLTSRGIPIVYQGTELGYSGGDDPANREDVAPNANHELYKYIAKLNAVRNSHPALQNGSQKEKLADGAFYSYQRSKDGDEVVVIINNSWNTATRTVSGIENLANGTSLKNQLGTDSVQVNNGSVNITLGPKEVKILAKAS